jgi:hypothetical protein
LVGVVVGLLLVLGLWVASRDGDPIRPEDRADPSLDFDEPWRSPADSNFFRENGRVYDQISVALAPGTELILPPWKEEEGVRTQLTIRPDGPAGSVTIFLQKTLFNFTVPTPGVPSQRLRDFRTSIHVWKRQIGAALVIDFDQGRGGPEGGSRVHALVIVGKGISVRKEHFDSTFFEGFGAHKTLGWEEVPQQPLSKSEWPLPVYRPPPFPR